MFLRNEQDDEDADEDADDGDEDAEQERESIVDERLQGELFFFRWDISLLACDGCCGCFGWDGG